MRTDCRHYVRRTSNSDEVVEACRIDAAPEAPYKCPENCAFFEKVRVSRAGWTVGSLGAPEPTANRPPPPEAEDLFSSLESEFDPTTVARIEEQERRRARAGGRGSGGAWWKRKKRR